MYKFKVSLTGIFFMLITSIAFAQCPINIGFDFGDFTNWDGGTGKVANTGVITIDVPGLVDGRQTIFYAKDHATDPYGRFLIASPNGSSACVRLGNSSTGAQAEQLTYTFTVPANDPDFSLIYYYAVVFQNPNHTPLQQPRFTANVFNITDNQYVTCGAFNFEASASLPGFLPSPAGNSVLYKDWSAVTLNLLGLEGKTLRLEFTTNDCSPGGHFGYVYLDVNQNCTSPVSGNVYCPGIVSSSQTVLSAPSGFQEYYWYNDKDFSKVIGRGNTLTLTPAAPIGSSYSVKIVPYPGIGCEDVITTTIRQSEPLVLKVKDTIMQCTSPSVNLTDTAITSGSNVNFTYTYYTDAACNSSLLGPQAVTKSGTYYIKATTPGGCSAVKPVVVFVGQSFLNITDPPAVCQPATVDITDPSVITGSNSGSILTYWKDDKATIKFNNPTAIDSSGTYYIKSTTTFGCEAIKPVKVIVNKLPKLVVNALAPGCISIDITSPLVTAGSSSDFKISYWLDAAKTQPLTNPNAITQTGTYYICATTSNGCDVIKPVDVSIFAPPAPIIVTNPAPVVYPTVTDLKTTFTPQTDVFYTFWRDTTLTRQLPNSIVDRTATYYIKATNIHGCYNVYAVKVVVNPPPPIDFSTNVFTPNGDGVNDGYKFNVPFYVTLKSFKIYNSYGKLLFETNDPTKYWDAKSYNKYVPVGTYYWLFNGHDNYSNIDIRQSGSVSVVR
ncbi:gliding motility-associated C-terminal domain-containing protein [Mucilaginibacter sp. HMF5004]|uniref:T9SS type B sorting domain-containing protein n=1 Tax=Mucilaginibacter rivuli TaxID=2857527 RepID=UPI001C5FFE98|nr:gliding motility-associated C-terminal domain-containing protein [Mucilaginibacter rivuli]MBW4891499.1 gliding motility-associated C-terminal domain-containing protein [Mucilaginibacter rivuli]